MEKIMPSGKKRTHEEFLLEFINQNVKAQFIKILGKYIKNNQPIDCLCTICNTKWTPTPKSLLNNHGCPKCSGNLRLTNNEFMERLKNNHNYENIIVLGKYKNVSSKIKCKCKTCKNIWESRAGDLLHSQVGCPICSGHVVQPHEMFLQKFKSKNPYCDNIKFLSKYSGALKKIKCKCALCNYEWEPIASSLLQGTGCPNCAKKRVAEKSKEILRTARFKNSAVQRISNDEFLKRLYKNNVHANSIKLITKYNGYNSRIKCMCEKCKTIWSPLAGALLQGQGCPSCSHSSTSFMEQFIAQSLIYYIGNDEVIQRDKSLIKKEIDIYIPKYNLAIEPGSWKWHKSILDKDIEKIKLCEQKGVQLIIIYDSCTEPQKQYNNNIILYSIDLGSEKAHKTLKEIVKYLLKLIGVDFIENQEVWNKIEHLSYCNSQRISNDDFVKAFNNRNKHHKDIILITKYTKAVEPIQCQCKICGNIWNTPASELLKGTGCPKCQIKRIGLNKQKKEIIKEWKLKNPTGNKLQCEKETGVSRMTVYKWWNEE